MAEALEILRKSQSTEDRALNYLDSIKRNLKRDVIDELMTRKDKLDDKLFALKDFSLETDINRGVNQITRDEAEKRFKEIIELEFELELLEAELKSKTKSYQKYFSDDVKS
jgi:hypothetical protein